MRITSLITLLFSMVSFADPKPTIYPVKVGKQESRAYWTVPPCGGGCKPRPAIILIPGSGAQGPEEMMPGTLTEDGKPHPLLTEIAQSFLAAGYNVLALGKPGVEYFSNAGDQFYDKKLYAGLKWKDLVQNVADAYAMVADQPSVDPKAVYLLGHSEGAQIAADFAKEETTVKGIFLLGYAGDNFASLLDYQLYQREIDHFVKTDVDANRDGVITQKEAEKWKEHFGWPWTKEKTSVTIAEVAQAQRDNLNRKLFFSTMERSALYSDGVFRRPNLDTEVVALPQDVYVFNGELDLQTPKEQALRLQALCQKAKKANCQVSIVAGFGHGFSAPKPPRRHPLLDLTIGGVHPSFLKTLQELASKLHPLP